MVYFTILIYEIYIIKDASEILGVNISTLKRWTDNGTLKCTKTAGGHGNLQYNTLETNTSIMKKLKKFRVGLENTEHEYMNI